MQEDRGDAERLERLEACRALQDRIQEFDGKIASLEQAGSAPEEIDRLEYLDRLAALRVRRELLKDLHCRYCGGDAAADPASENGSAIEQRVRDALAAVEDLLDRFDRELGE